MRILIVTDEYPPGRTGGIGVFYRDMATRLEQAGAQVRVVVTEQSASARPTDILRRRWDNFLAARKAAHSFAPDVVETHDWAAPLTAAPWRPLVVRLHGAHTARHQKPSRFWRLLEGRALAAADARVAVSRWAADATAKAFGLRGEIPVISSGIDTSTFRPPIVPRNGAEILYVGSPRADKGVGDLIEAADQVLARRADAQLTIAGATESDVADWTGRMCDASRARVRCLGRVPRYMLPALYGRATLCVFPGRAEALGLACLEAMATATPVIASLRGGAAELIDHERSGLLVDPLQSGRLSAAISRLLDAPERRREMGQAARRRIVEDFDLKAVTARNLRFYENLCTRFVHPGRRAA